MRHSQQTVLSELSRELRRKNNYEVMRIGVPFFVARRNIAQCAINEETGEMQLPLCRGPGLSLDLLTFVLEVRLDVQKAILYF